MANDLSLSTGKSGSAGAALAAGALAVGLLGWSVLALVAPGFAAMVAVFGSPVVACVITLRLLTLTARPQRARMGRRLSELARDPEVVRRVIEAGGGICHDCGSAQASVIRAALPVGHSAEDLERRFIALCGRCNLARDFTGRAGHARVAEPS